MESSVLRFTLLVLALGRALSGSTASISAVAPVVPDKVIVLYDGKSVKDLSQFWYSAQQLGVPEPQRRAWLERYARRRGLPSAEPLRHAIERKAAWIAKHDEKLREKQPGRNVSLPPSPLVGEGRGEGGPQV